MTKRSRSRFDVEVGARIRSRRTYAAMSLEALAARAEKDMSELSRYERGERSCPTFVLAKIAGALGCDVADLLEGVQAK